MVGKVKKIIFLLIFDANDANGERHSFPPPTQQWKQRCNAIKLYLRENSVFNFLQKKSKIDKACESRKNNVRNTRNFFFFLHSINLFHE